MRERKKTKIDRRDGERKRGGGVGREADRERERKK